MRTTLVIDDDVLDEARQLAAAEGRSLGAVVSALARRSRAPVSITTVDGLPVFDVPAHAPRITLADVRRAMDDE